MSLLRLADALEAVTDLIGRAAAWVTLLLVLLVTFNVASRYLFSWGTVWLQEAEWHLLAVIALFGITYTLRHGEHVRVDMLYERMTPRSQHLVDCLSALVLVVVALLVIRFSLNYVGQSLRTGEMSPDPGGLPARYVLKALIPAGFAVLILQAAAMALRHGLLFFAPDASAGKGGR
jgi:TRAP-type mannitol/chloroaromatic compound transport system permease small subunit